MAPSTSKEKMKQVSSGNYISDDIAFFILSKLPVKSIKSFYCVRKSWSLLLENPNFFKMFRDNLISKSHPLYDDACLILNQYLRSDDYWKLYFLSGDKFQNRVLLLMEFFVYVALIIMVLKILLWNPEIDQVKVIPSGIAELPPKVRSEIKLHGFGYDHVRNDYKVIQHVDMITFNITPWDVVKQEPFWEIYSLKSDS
ncbi:putative F-box domain-containing protein [Medicago truncatula]|uniref:Putative F-box domain-containing protein n=1 Tax=Medicago truncatula TaxID=3880 RepID=A0A396JWH2_MEDTR|nr:putative F-box protein At3g16210 [Medicago truncatula]RHN81654.1 putative F-box domain-containing protein [Medicago truncatula]